MAKSEVFFTRAIADFGDLFSALEVIVSLASEQNLDICFFISISPDIIFSPGVAPLASS